MPRVPTYDSFQAAPNTLQPVQLTMPAMPDVAGQQAQQMGRAMQHAGDAASRIALDMAQQANQLRIDDGMNQLVKARTDLTIEAMQLKGRNALERPDGKSLPDEYGEKLKSFVDSIGSGLGNDAQRQEFALQASRLQQHFYGTLSSHMLEQQGVYRAQTQNATIETAVDQAARLGPDEGAFQQSLGAIRSTVFQQTAESGGDDFIAGANYRKLADKVYAARYKGWQQQDAAAALENFQASQENIGPLARDQIGDELFRAAEPQLAVMAKPWMMESRPKSGAAAPGQADAPRGVRNNNPGNIVQTASPWQGEVQGHDPRFKTFATPEAGIKAMGDNLLAYQEKYGLNTVSSIVSRWAPATENNTSNYIATVSKALGVKADDKLNLRDPSVMAKLVGSMIGVENGKNPYSDAQITMGVDASLGRASLPTTANPSAAAMEPAWRDAEAKTGINVIDNLPPDKRLRVFQLAQAQMRQDMSQLRESLHTRVQDATAEYMVRGAATNPPSEDEFIRAYGQVDGVRRYQELQGKAELGLQLQRAKAAPNADLEKMLEESKPAMGEGFAAREHNYEALQRAVHITMEQRRKDPVAFALSAGAYGIQPLERLDNPGLLAEEMSRRAAAAPQMAGDYGTPAKLLTAGEAKAMAATLRASPVEQQKQLLSAMAQGVGNLELYKSTMQALAPDTPTIALAGLYQASGYRTTGGRDTADLILRGQAILTPPNAKEDGSGHMGGKALLKMPEAKRMLADWNAITGSAFVNSEKSADLYMQTARAIYAARSAEDGDYSGVLDGSRWEAAIQLATGGIQSHNGARIVLPYGQPYSQFRDYINTTAPAEIKASGGEFNVHGQKFTAADLAKKLPGSTLVNTGSNSYMVQAGTDVVRNANGSPYVLKVPH